MLADNKALLSQSEAQLERKQLLLEESNKDIAWLEETLALFKSKRYKHSSEKLEALQGQLFDESEVDTSIQEIKSKLAKEREGRQAKHSAEKQARAANRKPEDRPRRKSLPDHLRSVNVDVSPEGKHAMGDD